MKLKALDFLAVLISLLVIGAFSVAVYAGKNAARDVVIEASGAQWMYPLTIDRQELVRGPLGRRAAARHVVTVLHPRPFWGREW